jgi:Uri superfamily endonuclease
MLEGLPARPGAYILEIALDRPLAIETARLRGTLDPGRYAYAGSANGPGGLRARIARHLRHSNERAAKPPYWHVDRLTAAGRVTGLAYAEAARECDLADALAAIAGAAIPLAGFGSSDCRRCPAHLIRLPATVSPVSAITGCAALRYLGAPFPTAP